MPGSGFRLGLPGAEAASCFVFGGGAGFGVGKRQRFGPGLSHHRGRKNGVQLIRGSMLVENPVLGFIVPLTTSWPTKKEHAVGLAGFM